MATSTICFGVFEREQSLIRAIPRAAAVSTWQSVSAVGRASERGQNALGFFDDGGGLKRWGGAKANPLTGAWPAFEQAALLWVDGLGPLRFAGPVVKWMLRATRDGIVFDGVCIFGLALHAIGMPEAETRKYDLALVNGRFLLMAEVFEDQVEATLAELRRSGATDAAAFDVVGT